jgi:hypothetical protein
MWRRVEGVSVVSRGESAVLPPSSQSRLLSALTLDLYARNLTDRHGVARWGEVCWPGGGGRGLWVWMQISEGI